MTHEEITKKVTEIIVDKLGVKESEVVSSASFKDDLSADSLDTVEIVMEIEKSFFISIHDEKAEKISTVGEAITCVEEYLKAKEDENGK